MGSAASPFIVDNAIIGLTQPLTEAHGNNDDRDSMQRRFPHDGFLSSFPMTGQMLLRGLRQRTRAMSEVDVFTASEKRLRDLAVSFSRLRIKGRGSPYRRAIESGRRGAGRHGSFAPASLLRGPRAATLPYVWKLEPYPSASRLKGSVWGTHPGAVEHYPMLTGSVCI